MVYSVNTIANGVVCFHLVERFLVERNDRE